MLETIPAPDASTPEGEQLIHHDNTFGTPEEDAFRRDFTINALFYDIATFSVIDYVGGLEDLRAGIVRSIGDPDVRLREDPVRMLRAVALAARLNFTIDAPVLDATRRLRHEIAKSSPPRLLEEYYKILRAGSSEKAFGALAELGLLEPSGARTAPGGHGNDGRMTALLAVAGGARRLPAPIRVDAGHAHQRHPAREPPRAARHSAARPPGHHARTTQDGQPEKRRRPPALRLGELPLARRDVERLQQIMQLQRRLRELNASPRAQRADAPRHVPRGPRLAGDSRRCARDPRALEGRPGRRRRSGRRADAARGASRGRRRQQRCASAKAPAPPAPDAPARRAKPRLLSRLL